jgi:NAD(P)-dependent dehydrogenase (short-subunit alcohol dehydrogenase family)
MDLKLADKVALISGSTSGIGLAILVPRGFANATALAQEGATTIVNGRTQERVDAAIDRIKHSVPNAKLRSPRSKIPNGVTQTLKNYYQN